ncbi:hypothetical protein BOX15_Mlig024865g2, partial [Macrostomum lignano]
MASAGPDKMEQKVQSWLADNKSGFEQPIFGCTQQALARQDKVQQTLLTQIHRLERQIELSSEQLTACSTQLEQARSEVGVNQDAIRYLGRISALENVFLEASNQVTEQAISMAQVQDDFVIGGKKMLSDVVTQSWEWVSKLGELMQLHLKNSADYHSFYHNANELDGLLNSRRANNNQVVGSIPPSGLPASMHRMNTVLSDNLSQFLFLWQRTDDLVSKSHSVVPVYRRTHPVESGYPGRNIHRFDDGENVLQDAEEVTVLDNSHPMTWQVKKSNGTVMQVPSICIWLPPPDTEAVEVSYAVRRKLLNTWAALLSKLRAWIVDFYTSYLQLLGSSTVRVKANVLTAFEDFLNQVEQATTDVFSDTDNCYQLAQSIRDVRANLTEWTGGEEPPSVKESEVPLLHSLLKKLLEHMRHWKYFNEQMEFAQDDRKQLMQESSRIMSAFHTLSRIQDESRSQLEELQNKMEEWRLYTPMSVESRRSSTMRVEMLEVAQKLQEEEEARSTSTLVADNSEQANKTGESSADIVFESGGTGDPDRDRQLADWLGSLQSKGVEAASQTDWTVIDERALGVIERAKQEQNVASRADTVVIVEEKRLASTPANWVGAYSEYREQQAPRAAELEGHAVRQLVYNYIEENTSEVKLYLHSKHPALIVNSSSVHCQDTVVNSGCAGSSVQDKDDSVDAVLRQHQRSVPRQISTDEALVVARPNTRGRGLQTVKEGDLPMISNSLVAFEVPIYTTLLDVREDTTNSSSQTWRPRISNTECSAELLTVDTAVSWHPIQIAVGRGVFQEIDTASTPAQTSRETVVGSSGVFRELALQNSFAVAEPLSYTEFAQTDAPLIFNQSAHLEAQYVTTTAAFAPPRTRESSMQTTPGFYSATSCHAELLYFDSMVKKYEPIIATASTAACQEIKVQSTHVDSKPEVSTAGIKFAQAATSSGVYREIHEQHDHVHAKVLVSSTQCSLEQNSQQAFVTAKPDLTSTGVYREVENSDNSVRWRFNNPLSETAANRAIQQTENSVATEAQKISTTDASKETRYFDCAVRTEIRSGDAVVKARPFVTAMGVYDEIDTEDAIVNKKQTIVLSNTQSHFEQLHTETTFKTFTPKSTNSVSVRPQLAATLACAEKPPAVAASGVFREVRLQDSLVHFKDEIAVTGSGCFRETSYNESRVRFKEEITVTGSGCFRETSYNESRVRFKEEIAVTGSGCFREMSLNESRVQFKDELQREQSAVQGGDRRD